jgi:4'-phosphopantetheinyl transferase
MTAGDGRSGPVEARWVDLDPGRDQVRRLAELLDEVDRTRVARRATPALRRRATVSLAARRELAGDVLGVPADTVRLDVLDDGRRVAIGAGHTVALSVSTAGDVGLVAVADGADLGVDVEEADEVPPTEAFVARVCTPSERDALAELSGPRRRDALLKLWTRKEAYLKATGEGIGAALTTVTVPLDEGCTGLRFDPSGDGRVWFLFDLPAPTATLAAAIVVGPQDRDTPIVRVRSA